MGLQVAPAYVAQNSDASPFQHPVELDRNLLEGIFSRSGAMRYGNFAVTPTGVSRQLSIALGSAFVLGTETSQQGGYFTWSDAADTILAAAPSGSPRIDTLLLRIYDPQYGALPSGTSRAQWDLVAGTPAATPTALADSVFNAAGAQYVPGAWMKWAEIRTNPGDTTIPSNQIYIPGTVVSGVGTSPWLGRYVRVPGAEVFCHSGARPTDPVYGDKILEVDTGWRFWWNGTNWTLVPGQFVTAERTVDLPIVNDTTLDDDLYLFFAALPQNATFKVDCDLRYGGSTTGDFKVGWSCTGVGSSFQWQGNGADPAATTFSGSRLNSANVLGGTETYGGIGAATPMIARPQGILKTGTGTNITFRMRWAQGALDAVNGTTHFAGSRMTAWRLA